jgi:hypothetical protein
MVGGHPRTLEYLDALLRGGEAVFPDVADRLEAAIAQRGVTDPQQWMADVEGDLDRALAETVTLAADDVLLDSLLANIQDAPPAPELLRRLAVYRRPVDETGAAWQLSTLTAVPDPSAELVERLQPVWEAREQARRTGTGTSVEDLGLDPAALAQYHADLRELARPPVTFNAEARRALDLLAALGLVAPAAAPDDGEEPGAAGLFVHRWTGAALEARTGPVELADAHRNAAAHWRWRVAVWPQARAADVEQLLRPVSTTMPPVTSTTRSTPTGEPAGSCGPGEHGPPKSTSATKHSPGSRRGRSTPPTSATNSGCSPRSAGTTTPPSSTTRTL